MVLKTLVQTDILLTKTQANPVATSPQSRELLLKLNTSGPSLWKDRNTKTVSFPLGSHGFPRGCCGG